MRNCKQGPRLQRLHEHLPRWEHTFRGNHWRPGLNAEVDSEGGGSQAQKRSHSTSSLQNQPAKDPGKIHGGTHGYQRVKNPFRV